MPTTNQATSLKTPSASDARWHSKRTRIPPSRRWSETNYILCLPYFAHSLRKATVTVRGQSMMHQLDRQGIGQSHQVHPGRLPLERELAGWNLLDRTILQRKPPTARSLPTEGAVP